jgi:AraC-like DNA-binding protein
METIRIPIFPLSQFVKYIWVYESSTNKNITTNEIQTFAVEGCPIIIFHYKKPLKCKTGNNSWASHPQQCVIGQIKNFGEIMESGNEGMVAVVFYPYGLSPFIKVPLIEFTGLIVDLELVFGKAIKEIQEKICEANSNEKKILLVEHFLLNQIKTKENQYNYDIRFAVSQMQMKNKISILKLASEVNMSKRNFERKFLENVGLTPVFFNRIVRFQKAIKLINQQNKLSFTELAYSAGYYDQSHFIRDFKQFYGQPPKEFNQNQNFG